MLPVITHANTFSILDASLFYNPRPMAYPVGHHKGISFSGRIPETRDDLILGFHDYHVIIVLKCCRHQFFREIGIWKHVY